MPKTETDQDIVQSTNNVYEHRVPGAAVETRGDREAREALAEELVADTDRPDDAEPQLVAYDAPEGTKERIEELVAEAAKAPLTIDVRTPESILLTRDNIVADGAGTVGS